MQVPSREYTVFNLSSPKEDRMSSRRSFLRLAGGAPGLAFALRPVGIPEVMAATAAVAERTPEEVAADESYWREIQFAFTLDRTLINLNNGNQCPAPTVVHEACKRYMDWSNQAPAYHRAIIEKNIETARRRLAAEFGADPEEIAITRNASESLQIAQMGIDLKPGDEVITAEQDYPRMLTTWDQREKRDKIKVTRLDFPCPTTQADLLRRFEAAITPQTKVLHFCHITNQSGQLFPVRELSSMARRQGIITILDGAPALPDAALGERAQEAGADPAAFQPRTRPDLGIGRRFGQRYGFQQARFAPLG